MWGIAWLMKITDWPSFRMYRIRSRTSATWRTELSDVRLKIEVADRGGTAFTDPRAALEDAEATVEVRLTPLSLGAIAATAASEPEARMTVARAAASLKTAEIDAAICTAAAAVIRGLLAPALPTGLGTGGRLSIESGQSWVLSYNTLGAWPVERRH
jgi:hypothetical protein